mmetsp:Transcript_17827/g.38556  ORF Transcript_17827/g.38556 Transcript_17827/m.38556 type:complete len:376 (+) Transcript_17827:38-1165(+)
MVAPSTNSQHSDEKVAMSRRHATRQNHPPRPFPRPPPLARSPAKPPRPKAPWRATPPPRSVVMSLLCLSAIAGIRSGLRGTKIVKWDQPPPVNSTTQRMPPPGELEGDPLLHGVDPASLTESCRDDDRLDRGENDVDGSSFGLPLVVAWRKFPPSVEAAYRDLVGRISPSLGGTSGFVVDGGGGNDCKGPAAHVYPFEDLHVTVATFRARNDPAPANGNDVRTIKQFCVDVTQKASEREQWPREGSKLLLRPREVRLSHKNAIILWEESSGNLDAMRRCIEEEMREALSKISSGERKVVDAHLSFDVPPIVHSTFLRFWAAPSDPRSILETFSGEVSADILGSEFEVDTSSVALVFEDSPCMHVGHDETILWPMG